MLISSQQIGLYEISIIVAAAIIMLISVARLNDIDREKNEKRWWFRRLGLLMVFVSMVMTIAAYFTITAPYWDMIRKILFIWGIAISWITTPNQPPFWKYIARNDGD